MACLAAHHSGAFGFGRRPSKGLWAGLWEFPTFSVEGPPTATDVANRYGIHGRKIGEIRHVLTHRIVYMSVFFIESEGPIGPYDYSQFQFIDAEQLQSLGTSSLTEKVLAMVQDWIEMRD